MLVLQKWRDVLIVKVIFIKRQVCGSTLGLMDVLR